MISRTEISVLFLNIRLGNADISHGHCQALMPQYPLQSKAIASGAQKTDSERVPRCVGAASYSLYVGCSAKSLEYL